ncbi:MAG: hypothetical protein N3D09_02225 [Archaeoglobaceae archaeon]|nr:hypothetical protein [Archaeoglobaceae archaeon]
MRPFGVLVIGIFLLFIAFTCILGGLMMIFLKEEVYELIQTELGRIATVYGIPMDFIKDVYDFISIGVVLVGVLYLIDGAGVLMLKNWARILAILLFCFQMLYSTILFYYDPFAVVYIAIGILAIWYLLRRDVARIFGEKKMSIEERILGKNQ